MAPVLRPKHSLKNRSMTPLIKRLRAGDRIASYAKLARDLEMEQMSRDSLVSAVSRITDGEDATDLWLMAGKDEPDDEDMRFLLHHAICLANEIGQPVEAPMVQVGDEISEICLTCFILAKFLWLQGQ